MKMRTFSGHRNHPGMQGLLINSKVYAAIDDVFGPSSWIVRYCEKPDGVYAYASDRNHGVKVAEISDPFTWDGKSWEDLLWDEENIIANLSNGDSYVSYDNCTNPIIRRWLKDNQMVYEYIDQSESHGWHGFSFRKWEGDKEISYNRSISWPWTTSEGYKAYLESLKKLIKIANIKLVMYG